MRVLTVNAGSSSLKLALLDGERLVGDQNLQRWHGEAEPVRAFLAEHGADAIAHRVVHGGTAMTGPRVVDDELVGQLESLTDLAPLHQPRALLGIRAAREADPAVPSVVCVDTAFHADMPAAAATYALPREWNRRWGLRRFGFHGLSHAYAVRRGAELTGLEPGVGKVLSCHLGAGASMAAVVDGRCVDTTMGCTPEEGLVMNTRSGSIDPGLLGWLLTSRGMDPAELFDVLATRSGMAGLSGTSGDLRDVREAARRGEADAELAERVHRHGLVRHAGAMLAVLGGLDLVVFTGGLGEHHPQLRTVVCGALACAGVGIDADRNARAGDDADVTARRSAVRTAVVRAREDLEMARQAARLLS